jgi:hypothetical protein
MLFRERSFGAPLAISQPAHAWISGQLLRAWNGNFAEPLLLAAEQHDIGWMDWETAPSFNPATGRPHLFREIGASVHAPMWRQGVQRALAAWGSHVALLVSRHGGVIYRRYTDRHRVAEADATAAQAFLEGQAPIEAAWAQGLGLEAAALNQESALVAAVDTLSLALCGELKTPLELEAPDGKGGFVTLRLAERPEHPFEFVLSPWPFRTAVVTVEGEGRPLPSTGRFADEAAMQAWLSAPQQVTFSARLMSAGGV